MPQIRKTVSLAAGATSFPLQGSQYEFMQFDGLVEFALRETTATPQNVQASVFSGSDVLLENTPIDQNAGLNIQYPFDYNLSDVAAAGERLGVQLTNPGASAATVIVSVRITPAG